MTDFAKNSEDMPKKLSRRKWLRNAAITATSAVVLPSFLTGCHKDVWDKVGEEAQDWPRMGTQRYDPNIWYHLKVTYRDEKGATRVGFMAPIGSNWTTSFYDYMKIPAAYYVGRLRINTCLVTAVKSSHPNVLPTIVSAPGKYKWRSNSGHCN